MATPRELRQDRVQIVPDLKIRRAQNCNLFGEARVGVRELLRNGVSEHRENSGVWSNFEQISFTKRRIRSEISTW